jgi:hypothetical protein
VKNQHLGWLFCGSNEKIRKSPERIDGKWRLSLKAMALLKTRPHNRIGQISPGSVDG